MAKLRTNIRLEEGIERYLERIRNEGQSDASQYTARYALARFRKNFRGDPWVHLIAAADVDEYCFGPEGIRAHVAAITFNRYRSVLKRFFDYGVLMRWVDVNPVDDISPARPDGEKSRLMLNAGELLALLEEAANPVERIACAIGENTGMRANDIRNLKVFDASLASGTIQTEIRKTRKFDIKPITMDLHRELTIWLSTYADLMGVEPEQLENDWSLVPTYRIAAPAEKDKRIKPRPYGIHTHPWRLVQRPLQKMGYPTKGEGFHTLRRSSARAFFESLRASGEGRDHALMIVKEFLNHASVVQTEKYLGLHEERAIRDKLLRDQPFLSALAVVEQQRVLPGTVERIHHGS